MDSKYFVKLEYQGLKKLYNLSPRNIRQLNTFNTSDVETIRVKKDLFLVSSTDSLAIEIHNGLYKKPETWGYLSAVNSISDLAASGAKPIGMLISAQWDKAHTEAIKDRFYLSLSKALKKFKIPLLGGDSGSSQATTITTTILGETSRRPLSRLGMRSGDIIILMGNNLGYGPALAFDYLKHNSKHNFEKAFRPTPDWQTIYTYRKYFNSTIDTSDGVFNALDILAKVNGIDVEIDTRTLRLSKSIETYRHRNSIPIHYFIESDLGDLQTCVAINPKIYSKFKSRLPFHQIIAYAKNINLVSANVRYASFSNNTNRHFLPYLLEQKKYDYSKALDHWLKHHR